MTISPPNLNPRPFKAPCNDNLVVKLKFCLRKGPGFWQLQFGCENVWPASACVFILAGVQPGALAAKSRFWLCPPKLRRGWLGARPCQIMTNSKRVLASLDLAFIPARFKFIPAGAATSEILAGQRKMFGPRLRMYLSWPASSREPSRQNRVLGPVLQSCGVGG